MDLQNETVQVKELLEKANDVLVVTHERPTADSIGSALGLYLGLVSLGKKVTLACPDAITVGLSSFIGANKFSQQLGQKNFIISLDYVEGSIEKVSYNIEGNKFNLVIEPRAGYESFSQDKVHFFQAGIQTDLIIAIDTIHLGGFKKLYEDNKELFTTKPVVNIDRHPNNTQYGKVNIVEAGAGTTAELVMQVLTGMGASMTPDIATNILNAIYGATNNFLLPNVSPSTFETAAFCVKSGGKRFYLPPPPPPIPVPSPEERPSVGEGIVSGPASVPTPTPREDKTQPPTPSDWLKPKIFKSSSSS